MTDTKKYGLIIKKKTKENHIKKTSVFGNDSSDEEKPVKRNINVSLMREAQKKKEMKQTQIEIEKALKQDPSVYEYDNIYDDMVEKKKAAIPKLGEKDRKPKYIKGLLESAKSRKMEDERRMERKIQKEREQEGGEFQGKEEFVTSTYRKRMLELEEEEKQLKKREALDAANDVTKRSDLTMFYSNLLQHNVSMGGTFTAQSENSAKKSSDKISDKNQYEGKDSEHKETSEHLRNSEKDIDRAHRHREGQSETARKHHDERYETERRHHDERYETERRHHDERYETGRGHHKSDESHNHNNRREKRSSSEERSHRRRRYENREKGDSRESRRDSDSKNIPDYTSEPPRDSPRSNERAEEKPLSVTSKEDTALQEKQQPETASSSKFVKRSTNETVSSARERFLERKRAREMMLQSKPTDDSDED